MIAVSKQVSTFAMPGTGIPSFTRHAVRIAKEGIEVQVGRGRPVRLLEVGGTHPRSVRFPDVIWSQLEGRAQERGLTLHAALRTAILEWLKKAA